MIVIKETADIESEIDIERELWEMKDRNLELLSQIKGIMDPALIRTGASSMQDVRYDNNSFIASLVTTERWSRGITFCVQG